MKTNLFSLRWAILLVAAGALAACDSGQQSAQPPMPDKTGSPAVAGYEGNFEAADCQTVVGWIRDLSNGEATVSVAVYDGSTLLGTVNADIFRQDLKDAGKGSGKHGYSFPLPSAVKDGAQHPIQVKVSGSESLVYGSPRTVTCSPSEPQPPQ